MSIQTSYLQSSHLQIIAQKLKTHLPYQHKQAHCQAHIRTYTTPSVDKMTVDKMFLDKMTNFLYFHVDMTELKLGNEALYKYCLLIEFSRKTKIKQNNSDQKNTNKSPRNCIPGPTSYGKRWAKLINQFTIVT